ncbi:MAG: ankyrin repeat domain-containing protein [Cytophagaceae bacterium]|nr:MAG: ankyrin repeat domain-containing protein [Cytophagaceae bacterium]
MKLEQKRPNPIIPAKRERENECKLIETYQNHSPTRRAAKRQDLSLSRGELGLHVPSGVASCRQTAAVSKIVPPGMPPAVWASAQRDIATLKTLIDQGVDLEDCADRRFDPPIHQALGNFDVEMVELLLAHGASLEAEDGACLTVPEAVEIMARHYAGDRPSRMFRVIETEISRRAGNDPSSGI